MLKLKLASILNDSLPCLSTCVDCWSFDFIKTVKIMSYPYQCI